MEESMKAVLKPGWSKPSTILFASEIPVNEKAFTVALAQAAEFGAELILFHADDSPEGATEGSDYRPEDVASGAAARKGQLAPMAEQVRISGVDCKIVVRPGAAADAILGYLREQTVDRIVMGTHAPGPISKLLVGSVAEAVLRRATVPVCVVGPAVAEGRFYNFDSRTILCGVSNQPSSQMVVRYAAELAAEQGASLVLQHVIRPQERAEVLAGRSYDEMEAELLAMIPAEHQGRFLAQATVAPGDPTEELLYQSVAQQAELIVLGAQHASAFAAAARHGVVYKVLAHAQCPVMTLSPVVLESCGARPETTHSSEAVLAGVF
jgi:nucleotide-binding universal stress UspA family protein